MLGDMAYSVRVGTQYRNGRRTDLLIASVLVQTRSQRLPLRERKRLQARTRIVRAAEELFDERGFDAVSVTDIADRAEVGRTTFFRHFGDKQEVVFAQEQELVATIEADHRATDSPPAQDAAEAIEQLQQVVLALCAQATANPVSYTRHFMLVEQHPDLRARDALKMQAFADRLALLLLDRGCDPDTATFASQIALACYQTGKRSSNEPRSLVDHTRGAFQRTLSLGSCASEDPSQPQLT